MAGISQNTKKSLAASAVMLKKNVIPVFPRPWRTLEKAPERYNRGQIKLRVSMKDPAISLLNSILPANLPPSRKQTVQKIPKRLQQVAAFLTTFRIDRKSVV